MLILTGKSCSGKDTIKKELINKYGFENIVTYTSRPKRRGEKDGVSYNFISKKEFLEKIEEGFFAEYKEYKVANGDIWYYGCSIRDLEHYEYKDAVIILTPNGCRDIKQNFNINVPIFYVYANRNTLENRLLQRGDDKEEASRRLKTDDLDFNGWENEVTKIVYNNLDSNIKDVTNKILCYYKETI